MLSPVLLLVALILMIFQKGKVFFVQERPGYKERSFRIIKFRTMTDLPEDGMDASHEKRITRIGKMLRKTSLDELPQLWNVVRGEMSWVGPRPLLKEYIPLYSTEQRRRHNVKPGITGWTQVKGRTAIPWQKKLELDLYYAGHVSFWLDIYILLKTIFVIVSFRKDISDIEKPFQGN